jgi:hypothetical protein
VGRRCNYLVSFHRISALSGYQAKRRPYLFVVCSVIARTLLLYASLLHVSADVAAGVA